MTKQYRMVFRGTFVIVGVVFSMLLISCSSEPRSVKFENVVFFDGICFRDSETVVVYDGLQLLGSVADEMKVDCVINGSGYTLLPPMVNGHVHVWHQSELNEAVRYGVFTLLDMNNSEEKAELLRNYNNQDEAARFYSAGVAITVKGGHGIHLDEDSPVLLETTDVDSFVLARIHSGADYIKLMFERSTAIPSWVQCQKVIESAHRYGKLCVVHALCAEDVLKLTSLGADGFVHLWNDRPMTDQELHRLVAAKVFIIPTLTVSKRLIDYANAQHHHGQSYMTQEQLEDELKRVHEAGIILISGTDSPNFGINASSDIAIELRSMVEAGIPTEDALRTSTANVFQALGLQRTFPCENGQLANFLVVEGDLRRDIQFLENVRYVYMNGHLIYGTTGQRSRKPTP